MKKNRIIKEINCMPAAFVLACSSFSSSDHSVVERRYYAGNSIKLTGRPSK